MHTPRTSSWGNHQTPFASPNHPRSSPRLLVFVLYYAAVIPAENVSLLLPTLTNMVNSQHFSLYKWALTDPSYTQSHISTSYGTYCCCCIPDLCSCIFITVINYELHEGKDCISTLPGAPYRFGSCSGRSSFSSHHHYIIICISFFEIRQGGKAHYYLFHLGWVSPQ